MARAIESAPVGNTVGGAAIPQAVDPSYATWPDFARKTLDDIVAIWKTNLNAAKEGRDTPPPDESRTETEPIPPKSVASVFNQDTLIIAGVLILAVVGIRIFRG